MENTKGLDGTYWINYTAVSQNGITTALASTKDFRTFERHGVIFPPPNRDVTIFPEKIGGRYVALNAATGTAITVACSDGLRSARSSVIAP